MKGRAEPTDVIVIGGGIIGVACAEALTTAGLRVRLIEEDRIGSGTTKAGMGHIVQIPGDLLTLTRYSQQLWRSRAADWVGQVPIRPVGTTWLARTEEERSQLDVLQKALAPPPTPMERLEGAALRRHEPALSPTVTDGLWVKDDLVIDPGSAAVRLASLAQARKAEIMEGMHVESILEGGVRLAEGTTLRAQHVVVATGVETSRLLPQLGIRPRKGHVVQLATPNGYVRSQLGEVGYALGTDFEAEESVAFNAHPAPSGGLWVGASRQDGVDSIDVEERIVGRLLSRADAFLEDSRKFPIVRSWTGRRPASPDHRPFIGRWPGRPDLLVAAGHEGLGFTTALATGRLIADLLTDRASEIDRRPYALEGRVGLDAKTGGHSPARKREIRPKDPS